MPRRNPRSTSSAAGASDTAPRPFRVLLVDQEPQVAAVLGECLDGPHMHLTQVGDLAQARAHLVRQGVELVLIEPSLPDGSGLSLAQELAQSHPTAQTIVISGQPSLQRAVEAIRAGAADFIAKPLDLGELNQRVRAALDRHQNQSRRHQRVTRLRRLCKKLNQARVEVSQQVDILCNDLVTAYQELATRMQQVVQTSEFSVVIRGELDLEQLLQKTLEYLLQKAGPTNAAIFLPASADNEFTLGGYVNYDCSSGSADVLLQHLADVMIPKIAKEAQPVLLTDNAALAQWLGDDWNYLADAHLLSFACRHNGESLAVIALFRDGGEPFAAELVETCVAMDTLLADHLAKLIRIHHRHLPDLDGPA